MTERDRELLGQLEGRPSFRVAFPLGIQHVLAMFTSNITPILVIIGVLQVSYDQGVIMVQCAMLASGLTTLIQLYPIKIGKIQIGAGLPIVMGTATPFIPTAQAVGLQYGLPGMLGASLVGSLAEVVMGFCYKPLKKLFAPIVIGSVLIAVGFKLLDVGVKYFLGGFNVPDFGSPENVFLGSIVFLTIVIIQRFVSGILKISSLLVGIIVGYIVAIFMGKVDFAPIIQTSWLAFPLPVLMPWQFTYHLDAIFAFAAIYVIEGLETMGSTSGITIAAFNREAREDETASALLADAVGSTAAVLLNAMPNTAFSQNTGIIAMTKVANKWCVALGAFVLIIISFFPKVGAIFHSIPNSVLGGAVITVFAMILINGIKLIAKAGFSDKNVVILGVTFGIGLGLGGGSLTEISWLPSIIKYIFSDTLISVCIVSMITNMLFAGRNHEDDKKEPAV